MKHDFLIEDTTSWCNIFKKTGTGEHYVKTEHGAWYRDRTGYYNAEKDSYYPDEEYNIYFMEEYA